LKAYPRQILMNVAIECVTDIVAMLVRDTGKDVGDDYRDLEILKDENGIDIEMSGKLKKLSRMRNIIVHRYNRIEENLVLIPLNRVN